MNKKESNLLYDIQEYINYNICIRNSNSNPNNFKLLGDLYKKCKYILPDLINIQKGLILNSRNPDKDDRNYQIDQYLQDFIRIKGE